jgi:Zn-dependent M16 (insulinase) family peptidase
LSTTTWEQKQLFRENLLNTTFEDLVQVNNTYLKGKNSSKVIFGGEEAKSLFEKKGWTVEKPIY